MKFSQFDGIIYSLIILIKLKIISEILRFNIEDMKNCQFNLLNLIEYIIQLIYPVLQVFLEVSL